MVCGSAMLTVYAAEICCAADALPSRLGSGAARSPNQKCIVLCEVRNAFRCAACSALRTCLVRFGRVGVICHFGENMSRRTGEVGVARGKLMGVLMDFVCRVR